MTKPMIRKYKALKLVKIHDQYGNTINTISTVVEIDDDVFYDLDEDKLM